MAMAFSAQLPGLQVGVRDVVGRGVGRHVDGLGDGAGEERLHGRHHLDVAHVVDGARAVARAGTRSRRPAGARPAGGARPRSSPARRCSCRMSSDLRASRSRAAQRRGTDWLTIFIIAAAHQLLVLDERDVGLDAGGVAVHHEADGAGGRQHRDLAVAVAVLQRPACRPRPRPSAPRSSTAVGTRVGRSCARAGGACRSRAAWARRSAGSRRRGPSARAMRALCA